MIDFRLLLLAALAGVVIYADWTYGFPEDMRKFIYKVVLLIVGLWVWELYALLFTVT